MTQVERLVRYLKTHPGASGMEIIAALALPKYTSRISDARAAGFDIVCEKDRGINRYYLVEKPYQKALW